jgi:hypothetical protein
MEPDKQPNTTVTPTEKPLFNEPFQPPTPPAVVTPPTPEVPQPSDEPKSKLFLFVGIAATLCLLIVVVVFVLAASSKKPSQKATGQTADQSQTAQAATSTGVQFSSDSISQDISSLNDDQDFPAAKLSDEALGL